MSSGGQPEDWLDQNFIRGFGVQGGEEIRNFLAGNGGCFEENGVGCQIDNLYIFHRIEDEFPVDYDAFYMANTITADNWIKNEGSAIYQAENSVTLLPGFLADEGTEFLAKIGFCDGKIPIQVNVESVDVGTPNTFTVSIVPNPSEGVFNVQIDRTLTSVEYTLYDFAGRMILKGSKNDSREFSISRGDLRQGLYFLKVMSNNEIVTSKILIY